MMCVVTSPGGGTLERYRIASPDEEITQLFFLTTDLVTVLNVVTNVAMSSISVLDAETVPNAKCVPISTENLQVKVESVRIVPPTDGIRSSSRWSCVCGVRSSPQYIAAVERIQEIRRENKEKPEERSRTLLYARARGTVAQPQKKRRRENR